MTAQLTDRVQAVIAASDEYTAPIFRERPGAVDACIFIDFKQATDLMAMFGGEPNEITLQMSDGHSGRGMYASYTDMPEEGTIFLGNSDQEAMPDTPPAATPAASGETVKALMAFADEYAAAERATECATDNSTSAAERATLESALNSALSNPAPVAAPAPASEAVEPEGWRAALQFYADRSHFAIADDDAWDTVSGEPQNFWCDEAGTATVEDGTVAAMALRGTPLRDEEEASPPGDSADAPVQQAGEPK